MPSSPTPTSQFPNYVHQWSTFDKPIHVVWPVNVHSHLHVLRFQILIIRSLVPKGTSFRVGPCLDAPQVRSLYRAYLRLEHIVNVMEEQICGVDGLDVALLVWEVGNSLWWRRAHQSKLLLGQPGQNRDKCNYWDFRRSSLLAVIACRWGLCSLNSEETLVEY